MRISDWSSDVCSSDLRRVDAGDALGGSEHAHRCELAGAALDEGAAGVLEGAAGGEHRVEDEHGSPAELLGHAVHVRLGEVGLLVAGEPDEAGDRKSTRLKSSH